MKNGSWMDNSHAPKHLRVLTDFAQHEDIAVVNPGRLVLRARTASYNALQLALAGVNAALRTAGEVDAKEIELVIDLKDDSPRTFCAILR